VLRFLADESCDFSVVRALRAAGFDVLAILETAPGTTDERVIALVRREDTRLSKSFTVVRPGRIRITNLPG
jgi:hypothetical protein